MKILAFDQSTKLSGWSFFDDDKYLDSGFIDKHKDKDTDHRTVDMAISICSKIKTLKPDVVVIENIQQQKNPSTVIYLARLQGGIILYCATKNINFKILHPTEWRSVLHYKQGRNVKREELKQQSMDYVKNIGLDITSEDEAEAICIACAANIIYKDEESL